MRIFVSSTFEDLREHRAAAIRVLRQLGHEVVAMEDFVAGSAVPLNRVLDDVKRCDAYVGIFAWRYGYVPKFEPPTPPPPAFPGAAPGTTSITHYEYLQAKASGLDILAFLLDEGYGWPPYMIDGFAAKDPSAPVDNSAIRGLRREFQLERVISYFTTPSDLEARVSAAVTVTGMSKQVRLNLVQIGPPINSVSDSDPYQGIRDSIRLSGRQRVLRVDLGTTWWSTRLFLTAALAERLTDVRRIVVINGEDFVGLVTTPTILAVLERTLPALGTFANQLRARGEVLADVDAEMGKVFALWNQQLSPAVEQSVTTVITPDIMRRWFGDAMFQTPLRVTDLSQASIVDLLRILDYPSDIVPVVSGRVEAGTAKSAALMAVDKLALNAQLAHTYVMELMDKARIA